MVIVTMIILMAKTAIKSLNCVVTKDKDWPNQPGCELLSGVLSMIARTLSMVVRRNWRDSSSSLVWTVASSLLTEGARCDDDCGPLEAVAMVSLAWDVKVLL